MIAHSKAFHGEDMRNIYIRGGCRICRAGGTSDGLLGRLGLGQNAAPPRATGFVALGTLLALAALASAAAEDDWYPSAHGEGDTLGAINHLSPDKVVEAARLVKTGKTYALGVVTGWESPAYPPRHYAITVIQPGQDLGPTMGANRATGNDDLLYTWMGIGSQIDGLGHMGIDHVYYNGLHAKDFVTTKGLTALSIEKIPPMVGRGVLLDMTRHFDENPLPAGTVFNEAEIKAQATAQGVEIGKGDVVLFHTGWTRRQAGVDEPDVHGSPNSASDRARRSRKYHGESKEVVAVGADTWGLDAGAAPENPEPMFPVHPDT